MDLQTFFQHLANALSLGSLYALIAIGYTLVYGILRLINFAHGDIFMLGAYFAFYLVSSFFLPWWVAFIVAVGLTCIFGIGLERVAYRPLRDYPRISIMISAIGASFLIENLAIVLFDARPKAFPVAPLFSSVVTVGGVSIVSISFFIPVVTAVILAVLLFVVNKTKTGIAMRAVSTDYDAARLMGIDVNRIISFTFGAGSLLAAVGGIMWSLKYPQLLPLMGIIPGLKCFIAAVIGGIGNIEIMTIAFLPDLSGYRDAFAFVLLILVLVVKPTGLLGKSQGEKV
jgi:branched-chain amino acid transport system permease protein